MKSESRGADRTELTHARLLEVLDYDQETGIFTWKVSRTGTRSKIGDVAGSLYDKGYIRISIDDIGYRAHRLAWLYMRGVWPNRDVDHINGVRDDNRFVNLRDVTRSENIQNQHKAHSDNATGFLGVTFNKTRGKFQTRININGKRKNLGRFPTAELAHQAYLVAKRELHPACMI